MGKHIVHLPCDPLELWPDAPPAEIARAAGVIRSSAHGALQDLREVIGVVLELPKPTLIELPMLIGESRKAGMQDLSSPRMPWRWWGSRPW